MTSLGNAAELNTFSLSHCEVVSRKQHSRKARGKKTDEIIHFNRIDGGNKGKCTS